MPRYIDIDAFRADYQLGEYCEGCERYGKKDCDYPSYSARDFCGWLDDAPIVDAAPVKHGKWTTKRTQKHDGEWYCTECDYEQIVMTDDMKYCPGCGARMDLEETT